MLGCNFFRIELKLKKGLSKNREVDIDVSISLLQYNLLVDQDNLLHLLLTQNHKNLFKISSLTYYRIESNFNSQEANCQLFFKKWHFLGQIETCMGE